MTKIGKSVHKFLDKLVDFKEGIFTLSYWGNYCEHSYESELIGVRYHDKGTNYVFIKKCSKCGKQRISEVETNEL